jgi:hypothetical protein
MWIVTSILDFLATIVVFIGIVFLLMYFGVVEGIRYIWEKISKCWN